MPRSLGQRWSALFWAGAETHVGYVMGANCLAALAVGVLLVFEANVPLLPALASVVISFLLLAACLFGRRTVWIGGAIGAAMNGGLGGLVGVALTEGLHPAAPWIVAPLLFFAFAAGTLWAYRDVARFIGRRGPAAGGAGAPARPRSA
jgi:hypothetical protein